jgi:hypothetical protein
MENAVTGLFNSAGKAGENGGLSGNSASLTNATNAVTGSSVKVKSGNIKVSDPQDWTAAAVVLGVLALVLLKKV